MNARGIPTAAYQVLFGGVPPCQGTPPARSNGGTLTGDLAGVPRLGVDRQTDACQNITFSRTTYVVGNEVHSTRIEFSSDRELRYIL